MKDKEYWIWFSMLENNKYTRGLLNLFKSPKFIWNLKEKDLIKEQIPKDVIEDILKKDYKLKIENSIKYMEENDIKLLNVFDKEYPELLRNIYDYPVTLYAKGNIEILNDIGIAIVGCRNCSLYGKMVAEQLAYKLSKYDINIISGLARGIDTHAHIGSIKNNNKTIAVVGCGLDTVYPSENVGLFNRIVGSGGCVISEYPIGVKPISTNFPLRNRIISGMSQGVIVVEAKEKSGTFITVDFALEQGKNVYAVPGNITSMSSIGTNNLIKQGAKVITDVEDVLEDL